MKKKSKPTSVRLDTELLNELDQRCTSIGCKRNNFIKKAIEKELNGSQSEPIPKNCMTCDESSHEHMRKIISILHDSEESTTEYDDDDRIISFSTGWRYDN